MMNHIYLSPTISPSVSHYQYFQGTDPDLKRLMALCLSLFCCEKNDTSEELKSHHIDQIELLKKGLIEEDSEKFLKDCIDQINQGDFNKVRNLAKKVSKALEKNSALFSLLFPKNPSFHETEYTLQEYQESFKHQKSEGVALRKNSFSFQTPPLVETESASPVSPSIRKTFSAPTLTRPPRSPAMSPPRVHPSTSEKEKPSNPLNRKSFQTEFLFEDDIPSETRKERKMKEAIFNVSKPLIAKEIVRYFYQGTQKNRHSNLLCPSEIERKWEELTQLPSSEFESQLNDLPLGLLLKTSQFLLKKFPIESAARLRVCIDFHLVAKRLIPHSEPEISELFKDYKKQEALWIEIHQETLKETSVLNLSETGVQTLSTQLLHAMPSLKEVFFSDNCDTQPSPTLLKKLFELLQISFLDLSNNEISYVPPNLLAQSQVENLNVSGCPLPLETQNRLNDERKKQKINRLD